MWNNPTATESAPPKRRIRRENLNRSALPAVSLQLAVKKKRKDPGFGKPRAKRVKRDESTIIATAPQEEEESPKPSTGKDRKKSPPAPHTLELLARELVRSAKKKKKKASSAAAERLARELARPIEKKKKKKKNVRLPSSASPAVRRPRNKKDLT